MLTVIITDRHTTPLFATHGRIFAPFFKERGGSVCHCVWNEGGTDIENAVPELYGAIKGYPEWRALILMHPAPSDMAQRNPANPFDFSIDCDNEIPVGESPAPLIRLTHMLSGFPSLGVKNYEMGYTYYDVQAGTFRECRTEQGKPVLQSEYAGYNAEEREAFHAKFGDNLKSRLIEIPYSDKEKAEYKRLTKKYSFKENRPQEVVILSTREIYEDDDRESTRESIRYAWEFHDEEESSGFWKIYPNTCRFLCYDLINPEHTLYKREVWRFCQCALTLALNRIPGKALQAYRLYRVDVGIDAEELQRVQSEQAVNLHSMRSIIEERMRRVPEITVAKKAELVPERGVSVKFEMIDEADVQADPQALGLSSDCPEEEKKFWRRHIRSARLTVENILSAPQEIVADKALETRRLIDSFQGKEQVLDRFQIERIEKRLNDMEPRVMNARVYGMLNTDAHKAEVSAAGDKVYANMGLRLTRRNVLLISFAALFAYLCGFIPYLISSARIDWPTFGMGALLTFLALLILAVGGLIVLWFMKKKLAKVIKGYNKEVKGVFDRVNRSSDVYAEFFGSVATYMYGRSLLSGVVLKNENEMGAVKLQTAHLTALEGEIELIRELCSLYDVPLPETMSVNASVGMEEDFFAKLPSESVFYELSPLGVKDTLMLNDSGDMLDAPYSFITNLSLEREELYDRKGSH